MVEKQQTNSQVPKLLLFAIHWYNRIYTLKSNKATKQHRNITYKEKNTKIKIFSLKEIFYYKIVALLPVVKKGRYIKGLERQQNPATFISSLLLVAIDSSGDWATTYRQVKKGW